MKLVADENKNETVVKELKKALLIIATSLTDIPPLTIDEAWIAKLEKITRNA